MITKKWSSSPSVMKNLFSLWKVIITSSKKYLKLESSQNPFFHSWFWRNFSTLAKTGNHYGWSLRVIITCNEFHYSPFTTHNQKRCLNLCVNFTAKLKKGAESALLPLSVLKIECSLGKAVTTFWKKDFKYQSSKILYLSRPELLSFFRKDFEHRISSFQRRRNLLYLSRPELLSFFRKDFEHLISSFQREEIYFT